jgi:hypothetical protein
MRPGLFLPAVADGTMLLAAIGLRIIRLEKIRTYETPAAK